MWSLQILAPDLPFGKLSQEKMGVAAMAAFGEVQESRGSRPGTARGLRPKSKSRDVNDGLGRDVGNYFFRRPVEAEGKCGFLDGGSR